MKNVIKYIICILILFMLVSMINSCSKKIGIITPNKCKEMKFITIDNKELIGNEENLFEKYGKMYYLDNEKVIEIKEIYCTRYGYWDED